MKRSLSMSRVVFHPSTLAVFSGLLGALIGFLLNLASGGKTSQLLWIALIFALLFSLSITAWQMYRQEQTGQHWMTMLQEMVFQRSLTSSACFIPGFGVRCVSPMFAVFRRRCCTGCCTNK